MQIQTQNIDINICMHVYTKICTHTHTFFMYTYSLCVWKHTMVFNSHLPTSSIYIYIHIYHVSFFKPTLPPVDRGIYMVQAISVHRFRLGEVETPSNTHRKGFPDLWLGEETQDPGRSGFATVGGRQLLMMCPCIFFFTTNTRFFGGPRDINCLVHI